MYTYQFMETYKGKIVAISLDSRPFDTFYGVLWVSDRGFLISELVEVICDGFDLYLDEFNKRAHVSPMKYADITSFMILTNQLDEEVMKDIRRASNHIQSKMEELGFVGPPKQIIDLSKFPHTCPRCAKPAYIGAMNNIECSNYACSHYCP